MKKFQNHRCAAKLERKYCEELKQKNWRNFKFQIMILLYCRLFAKLVGQNKNTLANSTSHYESIDRNKCGRNQSPMLIRRAFFTTHFLSFTSYDIVLMNLKLYPAYPFDRPVHFISSSLKVSHKQVFSAKSLKTRNVREKGFNCVENIFLKSTPENESKPTSKQLSFQG